MIKNLPDGWKILPLNKLLKIQSGFAFDSKKFSKNKGEQLIRIRDLKNGYTTDICFDGDYTDEYIVKSGDYLIGMDGDFVCYQWKGIDSLLNQRVCRLNSFADSIKPGFIYYGINKHLEKIHDATSFVTVKHLSVKKIKDIEFLIPPLPQQEKIVKVLDISSVLIEKQKKLIEKYDLFLKSKFIEMFGDPMSNPMRWEVVKLGDITIIKTGKTPSRKNSDYWENGTVNWAKTTEVNQTILTCVEEKITDIAVSKCNMILFPPNTILIAMYGQGKTRGKVVLLGVSTTINQAFGAILENDNFDTLYLLKLLDYMYNSIRDLGRGGNQENLNLEIIRGINIILPPIELQNKFSSIAEKIEIIKKKETKKLEHLETLHNSLMDKAFQGEIG